MKRPVFDLKILYIFPSRLKYTRCNDKFHYGNFHYTYKYYKSLTHYLWQGTVGRRSRHFVLYNLHII